MKSEVPPTNAYTIGTAWETHAFGTRTPNEVAFNARMRVVENSLEVQGKDNIDEVIQSIRQLRLLRLTTEEKTYYRFLYKN